MTAFGSRLAKARTRAGLSHRELATRAGVAREYVIRLERGAHQPSREVVEALADAMSLDSYTRSMLLTSAGYVPLTDANFCQLIANIAAFWAKRNLTEQHAD